MIFDDFLKKCLSEASSKTRPEGDEREEKKLREAELLKNASEPRRSGAKPPWIRRGFFEACRRVLRWSSPRGDCGIHRHPPEAALQGLRECSIHSLMVAHLHKKLKISFPCRRRCRFSLKCVRLHHSRRRFLRAAGFRFGCLSGVKFSFFFKCFFNTLQEPQKID